jgi:hypothetical protein
MRKTCRSPVPASPAFEALAQGAQFRDRVVVRVTASPEATFRALQEVALKDIKLAWLLGEVRYLPSRLFGRFVPRISPDRPFLSIIKEGGTLVLIDDTPHEVITGSAGQLHRVVDQAAVKFKSREEFDGFKDPDYEKLFMSFRIAPTGQSGENWLVLEHATLALSPLAERKFRKYWRIIKPTGAFVSRELLLAIGKKAEQSMTEVVHLPSVPRRSSAMKSILIRSVRADRHERLSSLPGDDLIADSIGSLTHGITIQRAPHDVWRWLIQMGAGRAGWYSYDFIDNDGQRSAEKILSQFQHIEVGDVMPALPGVTEGFTVIRYEPERYLLIGWRLPDGTYHMTWAFVLEEREQGSTRLLVRARGGRAHRFYGLPLWMARLLLPPGHFIMQRKQLIGIARRAEAASTRAA